MARNQTAFITFSMVDGTSNEKKLIQDAVRGMSSAFGSLYDRYQPMIYRFVFVKVGRREDAEDLTHQVFISAWTNIRSYKDLGHPFSSWLYKIARNQIIDHYRARRNETSLDEMDPENFVEAAAAEAGTATKMEVEKVRRAIKALKPDYQDVIIMRFVEDLPLKEVAKAMDRTEGAIKLMQHRAIKELKKLL